MGTSVKVSNLRITAGPATLVDRVDFEIEPGKVLALIGESGSGKTTTALALMGYARHGCEISGDIRVGHHDVLRLPAGEQRRLRGREITYIAQSAAASFNPSRTIMDQVVEPALIHRLMDRDAAEQKAVALFRELALPDPESIGERYPHQVSGGQLQRLMAAMALITDPDLVILDEPTTALDVTTQVEVLRVFRRAVQERRTTAVYVSHDLAVVAQVADHILVLRDGKMRELGDTDQILYQPADDYTRCLLAAAKPAERPGAPVDPDKSPLLLEVRDLSAGYGELDAHGQPASKILESVDLKLYRGQAIGVIGESGSGKTTLARAVAGLVAPCHGSIVFNGHSLKPTVAQRSREELRRIQIVFQMADTALNPARTIEDILARPLQFFHGLRGEAQRARIRQLLDLVRLPAGVAQRLPGGLSGGQKQRVNLARALAAEPELILCDEITSALDTVVGAAILDLMAELRKELGVSYLFISHDLHTVRAICDEIVVMQHGRKVTQVAHEDYERGPHHPYFTLLARSVPELRRGWIDEVDLHIEGARAAQGVRSAA
ncbi:ABC transporter ATP-binding protein [Cupriavidus taiwanensis]|uniref:ABC transporter ATP-binding protein n=1 Tax=Cupriavidus taiwanensis TaxID=164546 RepID=UPI0039C3DC3B